MSVYIAADTSFFSQEAAQENNQTIEEYNEMVINNWNSIIGNDDWVLLLGTISCGSKEDNIKLFNNLMKTKTPQEKKETKKRMIYKTCGDWKTRESK